MFKLSASASESVLYSYHETTSLSPRAGASSRRRSLGHYSRGIATIVCSLAFFSLLRAIKKRGLMRGLTFFKLQQVAPQRQSALEQLFVQLIARRIRARDDFFSLALRQRRRLQEINRRFQLEVFSFLYNKKQVNYSRRDVMKHYSLFFCCSRCTKYKNNKRHMRF